MASENVKIRINEYDKTSPAGSSTDSTDIAFVPGFSVLATAPRKNPILCTTVEEFEANFGKTPKVLFKSDVSAYETYGFKSGDYDRSYVYAKELLYRGLPVVYANIFPENYFKPAVLKDNPTSNDSSLKCLLDKENGLIVVTHTGKELNNEVIFTAVKDIEILSGAEEPQHMIVDISASIVESEDFDMKTRVTDKIRVKDVKLELPKSTHCQINKYRPDCWEFINNTDKTETVSLTVKITLDTSKVILDSINPSNFSVKVEEVDNTVSCLSAVYDDNTKDMLKLISDKSMYSVKYITSGGYPSVVEGTGVALNKFATDMLSCAAKRGDAVALIDYQCNETDECFSSDPDAGTFYSKMSMAFDDPSNGEYGTIMYPWAIYNCGSTIPDKPMISMPASFAYLSCVARTIKTSPNWLAMAGVTRGIVPGINKLLTPRNVVSNTAAEEMQPKYGVANHKLSVNCITDVRPYGLTLWGNRTMKPVAKDGTVALNFLNIRNMLSDIKKLLYTSAKSVMFEQDSTDTWRKFKSLIEPLLRQLKTGNGISDYQIVRATTRYNGDPLTKGEIAAVIKIYPLYAIEYFELSVEINDQEVTVS